MPLTPFDTQSPIVGSVQAFADGGTVGETPEQLSARIAAKYGVSGNAPAPTPASVPAPAAGQRPAPSSGGGLFQKAADLLKGRTAQIDKAAGYSKGGKIRACARGGKIKGPGTATSDSIPAKVKQTGEDILVSNGERILSAKQDQLLHRIAQERGFDSVDAMLAAGTGEPVGPTIKAGKPAAANGAAPDDWMRTHQPGDASSISYPSPGDTLKAALPNTVTTWNEAGKDIGETMDKGNVANALGRSIRGTLATGAALVDDVVGNPIRQLLPAAKDVVRGVTGQPAQASPATSPITSPTVPPKTAQPAPQPEVVSPIVAPSLPAQQARAGDIPPGGLADRGGGIVASRGADGRLAVSNVGTDNFSSPKSPIMDGSASALIDQKSNKISPATQLERMQRMRLMSDLADPTVTDPEVKQQAAIALGLAQQGAKANLEDAQAAQTNAATGQVQQMEVLRDKLLDPATPPDERARLMQTLQAINGKANDEIKIAEAQTFDPSNPMVPIKVPYGVARNGEVFKVEDRYNAAKNALAARSSVPPGAIDMLRKDPSLAAQFDAKYGPGTAKQILGK